MKKKFLKIITSNKFNTVFVMISSSLMGYMIYIIGQGDGLNCAIELAKKGFFEEEK